MPVDSDLYNIVVSHDAHVMTWLRVLIFAAAVAIGLAVFAMFLFMSFQRRVFDKLQKMEASVDRTAELLELVKEHSATAREQNQDAKAALERTKTAVSHALEDVASRAAAAVVSALPPPIVMPLPTMERPLEVHVVRDPQKA